MSSNLTSGNAAGFEQDSIMLSSARPYADRLRDSLYRYTTMSIWLEHALRVNVGEPPYLLEHLPCTAQIIDILKDDIHISTSSAKRGKPVNISFLRSLCEQKPVGVGRRLIVVDHPGPDHLNFGLVDIICHQLSTDPKFLFLHFERFYSFVPKETCFPPKERVILPLPHDTSFLQFEGCYRGRLESFVTATIVRNPGGPEISKQNHRIIRALGT